MNVFFPATTEFCELFFVSVLSKTLYHIIETISLPLLKTLEQQLNAYKQLHAILEEEKKQLLSRNEEKVDEINCSQ